LRTSDYLSFKIKKSYFLFNLKEGGLGFGEAPQRLAEEVNVRYLLK